MARLFDDASNQYLDGATVLGLSAYPYSWGGWFRRDASINQDVMGFYDDSVANRYDLLGINSSNNLNLLTNNNGTTALATATAATSSNIWQYALAVIAGTQDRSIYLDGGNKGINIADNVARASGIDSTNIGVRGTATKTRHFSGMLAECAAWNIALTDAEAAVLKLGVVPHYIRPNSIIAYWRIMGRTSPEIDQVGGFDLTLVNAPTVADHPPMMFRPPVYVGTPEAAAAFLQQFYRIRR